MRSWAADVVCSPVMCSRPMLVKANFGTTCEVSSSNSSSDPLVIIFIFKSDHNSFSSAISTHDAVLDFQSCHPPKRSHLVNINLATSGRSRVS